MLNFNDWLREREAESTPDATPQDGAQAVNQPEETSPEDPRVDESRPFKRRVQSLYSSLVPDTGEKAQLVMQSPYGQEGEKEKGKKKVAEPEPTITDKLLKKWQDEWAKLSGVVQIDAGSSKTGDKTEISGNPEY